MSDHWLADTDDFILTYHIACILSDEQQLDVFIFWSFNI